MKARLGGMRAKMKRKPKDDSEKKKHEEEEVQHQAQRDKEFAALNPEEIERCFTAQNALPGAITGLDVAQTRMSLMAGIAASEAYAYASFPYARLMIFDQPYARLLRLIKSTQLYTLCEGVGKILFVAIPGTHDMRTTMTDLKTTRTKVTCGKKANGEEWNYKIHSGFKKEADKLKDALPIDTVKEYLNNGYQIVVTGHSLGGALASLTTLRFLDEDPAAFSDRIECITFGAPLIGNSVLTAKIEQNGWMKYFRHFVYRSDIVPRVLTGRGLTAMAMKGAKSKAGDALSKGLGSAKSLFGKLSGSKKEEKPAPADSDAAPEDEVGTEEQLDNMEVDESELDKSFAKHPDDDKQNASDGDTSANPAAPTRAFDCYGTYHYLRRDVEYKSSADPSANFATLRGGDGLKTVASDHSLLTYHAVLDEMTGKK